MIKVTNLKEIDQIQPLMLKAYIAKKMTAMMREYVACHAKRKKLTRKTKKTLLNTTFKSVFYCL